MSAKSIMNALLGWLKALADWTLGLFDLSDGSSPIKWMADNWLFLLIVLMIVGVLIDFLIWLIRWRPYWIWLDKKRIIIDDDHYFDGEELLQGGVEAPELFRERLDAMRAAARKPRPAKRMEPDENEGDFFTIKEDAAFDVSDLPVSRDEKRFVKKRRKR